MTVHKFLAALCVTALSIAVLPATAVAEEPAIVELITAEETPIIRELRVVGAVEATDSFPASFRRGGQIVHLAAEVGEHISAGTVIAQIDPTNIDAELDAARANLDAADAALMQAEQARARTSSMLERGVGTQAQYDAAQQTYLSAKATTDQAHAVLETAEQAVKDTDIRAERDVTVIDRYVDLGEVVSAGTAVVKLAPKGRRQAVFLAPDAAGLSRIRGHEVDLDPSGPVPPFKAIVSEVLPVLNATGTVEIRAEIPAELSADIPIGTSITGSVSLMSERLIELPWTALSANGDGAAVWVVNPDTQTVFLQSVTIGAYGDDTVEISEGLSEGDIVVGGGSHRLYDGRAVLAMEAVQ